MLLKMVEGTEIVLDDVDEDYQITINTKNILFIVSGAFEGMKEKTKENKKIGFTESSNENKQNITEKLMKFGMIKEFVGRFPVIAKFEQHTKESLQKILTETKNSLVSQYQNIFLNDNIKLEINNEAVEKIAQISIENNTGARGLKNSMENLLADTMFEYLGNDNIEKVVITKETVSNKKPDIILKSKKIKSRKKAKKSFF
jgi:ATP-dependent clp protease ATP-binding subunit clpX